MPFFYFLSFPQKGNMLYFYLKCENKLVGVNMAIDNYQKTVARRKRRQRRETIVGMFVVLALLLPAICCVLLLVQISSANKKLENMGVQLEQLAQNLSSQQEQLQESLEEVKGMGLNMLTREQETVEQPQINSQMEETTETAAMELEKQDKLHKVYLTFDDGPGVHTNDILDILKRYDVKATFFIVGKDGEVPKELLRRIAEEGHTIGLHSYSHKYDEIYHSKEAFASDFHKIQNYVYQVTGQRSKVYRFPGGSSNTVSKVEMQELAEYLQKQGVEFYDWNISSGDGGSEILDVDTLVENATSGITSKKTSIILMHDAADKNTTVEALPIIIENILAMEDTVILPITEETKPVHHIDMEAADTKE